MLNGFAVDVRPVKIKHSTAGRPEAVEWGRSTGQHKVKREACLVCVVFPLCLFPPVDHSLWAVLLLNGHSKSTCNLSVENGYTKLFNTPLNLLGQSQLVLHHIFYSPDLLCLSWRLLLHCVKKTLSFLELCLSCISFPSDSFTLLLTVVAPEDCVVASAPPFFQVTFLILQSSDHWANKHSLAFLSSWFPLQPCGWKWTGFPKGKRYWDTWLNSCYCRVLLHTEHATRCLCSHTTHCSNSLRVFHPCLSLTSLH